MGGVGALALNSWAVELFLNEINQIFFMCTERPIQFFGRSRPNKRQNSTYSVDYYLFLST